MKNQKTIETLRSKARGLRISYIRESDPKKGTSILKARSKAMESVHALQDEINETLLSYLLIA